MAHRETATLNGMGDGPPKPTPARVAIAENLKKLMAEYITDTGKEGISPRDLEKLTAGAVGYKTVQRLLDTYNDVSPTLESLDTIAHFFGIDTFKLLVRRKTIVSGQEVRVTETHASREGIPAGRGVNIPQKKRTRG